ncbi:hypothetical protein EV175_000437 [Coemansia sp. RSA 1933]|nr:hypothetical protein EV175_000437 [Coemansia sp. RSA 1933]
MSSPPPKSTTGHNTPISRERRRRRSVSPPNARNCPRPDHLRSPTSSHRSKHSSSKSRNNAEGTHRKSLSRRTSKKRTKGSSDTEEKRDRRRSRKESVATVIDDGLKTPLPLSSSSSEAIAHQRQSPPLLPPKAKQKQAAETKERTPSPEKDKPDQRRSDTGGSKTVKRDVADARSDKTVVSSDALSPSVSTPGKRLASVATSPERDDGDNDDRDGTNSKRQKTDNAPAPEFGLSGRLAAETNTVNGVVLKYSEPPEARRPGNTKWRIYVFKDDKDIDMHHVDSASGYLFGRDRKVADIPTDHPSCSSQHAVLQYRQIAANVIKPYIIDLSSTNGTFLNDKRIPPQRYVELRSEDVIKLGFSTREYVLLRE